MNGRIYLILNYFTYQYQYFIFFLWVRMGSSAVNVSKFYSTSRTLLQVLEILGAQSPTRLVLQILEEVIHDGSPVDSQESLSWRVSNHFCILVVDSLTPVKAYWFTADSVVSVNFCLGFFFSDKENKKNWCTSERWTYAIQYCTPWCTIFSR